jgi:hypothetical protein
MKNTPDLAKSAQKRSPRHALVRKSSSFVHSSTATPLFSLLSACLRTLQRVSWYVELQTKQFHWGEINGNSAIV